MAEIRKHIEIGEVAYTHVRQTSSYEGGQCLERDCGYFAKKNSCSYRGQAAYRARQDKDMYKVNEDEEQSKKEWVRVRNKFIAFSGGEHPWANNAHHIVPIAALKGAIAKVPGTKSGPPGIKQGILKAFVEAPYNVNHWSNMIVLPCEARNAADLGLPMHPPKYHSNYSKHVGDEVFKVFRSTFRPYLDAVRSGSQKDHAAQEASGDVAKKIVEIQEKIYADIQRDMVRRRNEKNDFVSELPVNIEDYDVAGALTR